MLVSNVLRNDILDLLDRCDGGSLKFRTVADAVIATCALSTPAFQAPSGGSVAANAITREESTAAGTIAHAILAKSDGTEVLRFTVGVANADIIISSLNFAAGEPLEVTSLVIDMPAS